MLTKDERPRKFSEVIGHEKNILAFTKKASTLTFDFPDVIILTGNTGSGKTTSAFIIGSTINCEKPSLNEEGYYDPCGKCPSCLSVIKETFNRDVHFYKSSEMEKDDIIKLEELASSAPLWGGRKQVIIIDEAQNLSKSSKGATLNLLEHKRKDTVFILCTMDASSLDKAVLNRGQVYDFKPLSFVEIGQSLTKQLDMLDPEEKLPFEPEALVLLAQNSYGSIRQALQYLERCIDSELYTVKDIEKELSFISEAKAYQMLDKLLNKDNSFFEDLSSVTNQSFYTYAWAVLSTATKTILTLDSEDWKYKSSRKIVNHCNYQDLMNTFMDINNGNGYYFKDYIFHYFIGSYMNQKAPIVNRIEEPTRRVRQPRS